MIKVTLITVGKIKEKYFAEASVEYEKRLSAYCKLEVKEVAAARLPQEPSAADISAALKSEAERIMRAIPQRSYLIPLCIEGKQMPSEQLSKKIESAVMSSAGGICFIIGGSYGIADEIKNKADLKLSMSEMTFPHRLARVMLLEQIYRAFKISEGGTYHK